MEIERAFRSDERCKPTDTLGTVLAPKMTFIYFEGTCLKPEKVFFFNHVNVINLFTACELDT